MNGATPPRQVSHVGGQAFDYQTAGTVDITSTTRLDTAVRLVRGSRKEPTTGESLDRGSSPTACFALRSSREITYPYAQPHGK